MCGAPVALAPRDGQESPGCAVKAEEGVGATSPLFFVPLAFCLHGLVFKAGGDHWVGQT